MTHSSWARRGLVLAAVSGLTVTMVTAGTAAPAALAASPSAPATDPAPPTAKQAPADALGAHDADLLAKAEAKGVKRVTVLITTDKGKSADVVRRLDNLGATVGRRFDTVGYVRASVPTSAVLNAAKLPGVSAVDLDETIKLPDPSVESAKAGRAASVAAPGPTTPASNPYMPTNETGAVAFKAAHPGWDGRGVTIGIMDSGVDLDHPALATTTTGQRKIVDWVTETDPLEDASWRAMLTAVTGPTFSYAGSTWTAPAGSYLVNRFSESITAASEPGGDINRDGDTTDTFGVLYNPVTHDVWVDVNQDHNFTNDRLMRPYKEKYDVNHFGTDKPSTEVNETTPFVVEYREDVDLTPAGLPGQVSDFVNIGLVEDAHGSHVAGITAANDMLGNHAFDGAAPGAKLVSARACTWGGGCTAAALFDGMADLVINRHVDVVNMSIGGLPALNDGNNARAELYDRLIQQYGVQMFISAGNSGPGVNTVGDPSVATNVVSVAASVSKQTWLANYGSVVRKKQSLFPFSSRGPREDGGFKPSIAAPGSAISTVPQWLKQPDVAETGYTLPIGYAMFQGTSMASPQAAGAAALLLSAGKATGKGITPAMLRRAIYTSAKPIAGEPVYAQGNGEFNVPGAWRLLKAGVQARTYSAVAPVCTPISDLLATPNKGTGIYNRCAAGDGGQKAGQAKTYPVKITRTSGPAGTVRHKLTWLGNDRTFSSANSVQLPLNKAVTVQVTARPSSVGAHGAILRVDDPATNTVDFEIENVVVVSNPLAKPSYGFHTEGQLDRNSTKSVFVTVPEGAATLQVDLAGIAPGSQTRFIAINPWGVPVESTASNVCYPNYEPPGAPACDRFERDYANPIPGVWEIELEARRTSPYLTNPFELTARAQGVQVEPQVVTLPSVEPGTPSPVSWKLTNQFGPVTVTGEGGPLGSSHSERASIANGDQLEYTVTVPEGATRLDVAIGNTSDLGADLDLTVYRDDTQVGQSADGDSEEAVSIANPEPGTYRAVIDGFSVPAGTTQFDYRDVFYSPALGSLSVASTTATLVNGQSTTVNGTVTANTAPAAGRQLFGEMQVVTDEGAVVGTGSVQIGSVD